MNAWHGDTVVILASGPSLTVEQCESVREWRERQGGRVIVINTTFRRAPWADVLYACDGPTWWTFHADEVRRTFRGDCWTQDETAAQRYGLRRVKSAVGVGLSRSAGVVFTGGGLHRPGNSGYQVLNLAYQWGAARMILLGYDMQASSRNERHWHAPHPVDVTSPYAQWVENFGPLARDLAEAGVDVVNATPDSALRCFPSINLDEALNARTMPTP